MKISLAMVVAALSAPSLLLAADEAADKHLPDGGSGAGTNDLVFKKRPRRRYDAQVIVAEAPDGVPAVPTPVSPVAPTAKLDTEPRPVDVIRPPPSRSLPPPARPMRPRRSEDEEWLMTPEQRLAKELEKMSGEDSEQKQVDREKEWLVNEVQSLDEARKKKESEEQQRKSEDEEAEQIAAIMGRDLLSGLRGDGTTPDLFRKLPSPTRGSDTSSQGSPTEGEAGPARGMTASGARRDVASGGPGGSRAEKTPEPRSRDADPDAVVRAAIAAEGSDPRVSHLDGAAGQESRQPAAGASTSILPSVSPGMPSLFDWSSKSRGNYAGLPASLAPPSELGAGGALRDSKSTASPSLSTLPRSTMPAFAGTPSPPPSGRASPWTASGPAGESPPAEWRRPAPVEPPRLPFLNAGPAPGTMARPFDERSARPR